MQRDEEATVQRVIFEPEFLSYVVSVMDSKNLLHQADQQTKILAKSVGYISSKSSRTRDVLPMDSHPRQDAPNNAHFGEKLRNAT
jgi:hypothetical protein